MIYEVGMFVKVILKGVVGCGKTGMITGYYSSNKTNLVVDFGDEETKELYYFPRELIFVNNSSIKELNENYNRYYCKWCECSYNSIERIPLKKGSIYIKYCPECLR